MFSPQTRDKLLVLVGGSILVGIVLLSWIPSQCPVLRNVLIGCPTIPLSVQSPEERETNRIPHQKITSAIADFSVKTEENRTKTRIVFYYRTPNTSIVTLQLEQSGKLLPLATVSHPVLYNSWTRTVGTAPESLLLRSDETDFRSIREFVTNPGISYAADASSVSLYKLMDGTYISLESMESLEGIDAALLSHHPPTIDGSWKLYEQEMDLTEYKPENGMFHFMLFIERNSQSDEFLLGNVNIDFRK